MEFALIAPLLIVILFSIVEIGSAFAVAHSLSTVSREGANIAARGTALDTVLQVVLLNGSDVGLQANGGTIVSKVTLQSGDPVITEQVASSGYAGMSELGAVGATATELNGLGLADGATHYVVEVFYIYNSITPLSNFVSGVIPNPMYERAIF